jgi:glycine cleavage system H protein
MKVFPDDLFYNREHAWDYAQEKMGEIISVELPEVDVSVELDEPFGTIESSKGVFELISPLSGDVISVNEDVMDDIGIINSDPHDTGWMIVIDMSDPEELDDLLDSREYHDFIIREAEDG